MLKKLTENFVFLILNSKLDFNCVESLKLDSKKIKTIEKKT